MGKLDGRRKRLKPNSCLAKIYKLIDYLGISIHKLPRREYLIDYDDARINFLTEYDRSNPITSVDATKKWIEFLKIKHPHLREKIDDLISCEGKIFCSKKKDDNLLFTSGMNKRKMEKGFFMSSQKT
jgi:hypothetical protein